VLLTRAKAEEFPLQLEKFGQKRGTSSRLHKRRYLLRRFIVSQKEVSDELFSALHNDSIAEIDEQKLQFF